MKFWVSVLTVAVAFLGIAYYNLYCSEMKFDGDSAGVLISALGVIVTALVGWQVYNAIEMGSAVKQVNDLKEKLSLQSQKLEAQDKRNLCLIEAFQFRSDVYDEVKRKRLAVRYQVALQAIRQFLRAGTPSYYMPLWNLVSDLSTFLDDIHHAHPRMRKLFNDKADELEELYDDIISEIDKRIDEMGEIKKKIKQAHKARLKIHNLTTQ